MYFFAEGRTRDKGMPPRCVYLVDVADKLRDEKGSHWYCLGWDNIDQVCNDIKEEVTLHGRLTQDLFSLLNCRIFNPNLTTPYNTIQQKSSLSPTTSSTQGLLYIRKCWPGSVTGVAWHGCSRDRGARGPLFDSRGGTALLWGVS